MNHSAKAAPAKERIQKLLAQAGLGSRRSVDKLISQGQVKLNGRTAQPGDQAGPGDRLEFNHRRYQVSSRRLTNRTLIYNKPEGRLTTRSDPQGRPTVFEQLPRLRGARWIAVGRLDINTSGLLLLTTDGELAHKMMHPSSQVDREYICRVRGEVTPEKLARLRAGVELTDGMAHFSDIKTASEEPGNKWYYVVLMEGRNREVRRLWESQGIQVSRLKRVRYGAVFLPKGLRTGQHREITASQHRVLREDVGLPGSVTGLELKVQGQRRATGRR